MGNYSGWNFFTGRIDDYFNDAFGNLEYNLARLDNFGNEVYDASKTTLSKVDCIGEIELFYPKNDAPNATLYEPSFGHHCRTTAP